MLKFKEKSRDRIWNVIYFNSDDAIKEIQSLDFVEKIENEVEEIEFTIVTALMPNQWGVAIEKGQYFLYDKDFAKSIPEHILLSDYDLVPCKRYSVRYGVQNIIKWNNTKESFEAFESVVKQGTVFKNVFWEKSTRQIHLICQDSLIIKLNEHDLFCYNDNDGYLVRPFSDLFDNYKPIEAERKASQEKPFTGDNTIYDSVAGNLSIKSIKWDDSKKARISISNLNCVEVVWGVDGKGESLCICFKDNSKAYCRIGDSVCEGLDGKGFISKREEAMSYWNELLSGKNNNNNKLVSIPIKEKLETSISLITDLLNAALSKKTKSTKCTGCSFGRDIEDINKALKVVEQLQGFDCEDNKPSHEKYSESNQFYKATTTLPNKKVSNI